MWSSFQCTVQQQIFPKTEDWHHFAAASGIEPTFFHAPGENHQNQPTTCFVLSVNNQICAIAPHFTLSHECGLWVAPSRRGQGFGRVVFAHLLAHNLRHLYATVSHGNPHAGAMEHLLRDFGFHFTATARDIRIWALPPKG